MLLYGPPGSGKSSLAKAIADYCNFPRQFINASSIVNQYKNSGQSNLRHIFKPLLNRRDYIAIIFDELTGLTNKHNNKKDADEGTIEELLKIFDHCESHKNLLFIATTNDIKNLPEPIKDRFCGAMFNVEAPNKERRKKYIVRLLTNHTNDETTGEKEEASLDRLDLDLQILDGALGEYANQILNLTEAFSTRQLNAMRNLAYIFAIRRNVDENYAVKNEKITTTMQDYKDAIGFIKIVSSESSKTAWEKYIKHAKDFSPHVISFMHTCISLALQCLSMYCQLKQSERHALWQQSFQQQTHTESLRINEIHHQEQMAMNEKHHQETFSFQKKMAVVNAILQFAGAGFTIIGTGFNILGMGFDKIKGFFSGSKECIETISN